MRLMVQLAHVQLKDFVYTATGSAIVCRACTDLVLG